MKFKETELPGAFLITPNFFRDDRGFFCETWNQEEFTKHDIKTNFKRHAISFNAHKGTLRGMHFQKAPHTEAKLIHVTQGRIFDVIVDVRPESKTFCRWTGVELDAKNPQIFYVPKGFAHGFVTLEDNCALSYQLDQHYVPQASTGVRWNDPAFDIRWPLNPQIISDQDKNFPDFKP